MMTSYRASLKSLIILLLLLNTFTLSIAKESSDDDKNDDDGLENANDNDDENNNFNFDDELASSSNVSVDCSNRYDNPIELVANGELVLYAVVNPVDETMVVELVRKGQGWLALGFYSGSPTMHGSEAVIGLPDKANSGSNPAKYDLDSYGVEIMENSRQTLTNAKIVQNTTHTVLTFTKPIEESSENDVEEADDSSFLWAVGSSNTLAQHSRRGAITVTINQCVVTKNGEVINAGNINQQTEAMVDSSEEYRNLWIAHGATAATAWAILVPLAVGSSLIRKIIEKATGSKALWFQLHRGLNGLAIVLTLISFSIAVSILNERSSFDHFSDLPHHTLGLVIFILSMLQGLNGVLRPHLPHAPPPPPTTTTTTNDEIASHPNTDEENEQRDDEDSPDLMEHAETENSTNLIENVDSPHPVEEEALDKPIEGKKSTLRIAWEIGHRVLGVSLLAMSWWQVQNGLGLFLLRFPDDFNMIPVFWGVALGITGVVLVLYFVQMFLVKKL